MTIDQAALVCAAFVKDCGWCGGRGYRNRYQIKRVQDGPRKGQKRPGVYKHTRRGCDHCKLQNQIARALTNSATLEDVLWKLMHI